ncbi:hypothetical protein B0H67DRAFT_644038 [Lasiosphaeris hirsuta]|uniref:Uncharacterized protein n=1 Tax=Lasiosphaeris hirsuta TaxID=260670 RepID=A0AA40E1J3_9PEZI|nr:hypothetical protein B0H67DRAFT_644038 [Lasiosphaeris hirsuta]
MDPLSALSVAATVIQFVELGGHFLAKGWDRYKHPDDQKKELASLLQQLSSLTTVLHEARSYFGVGKKTTGSQQQLLDACASCDRTAAEFQDVLSRATNDLEKLGSSGPRVEKLVNVFWGDSKIEKVKTELGSLRSSVTEIAILCIWEDTKQGKKKVLDLAIR